jgi:trimethylamine--corrinoid protein Co-methyltransferase
MASGMACSCEQLVMGNEIIGMTKRFVEGITVDADTLARDVMDAVGPGGNFLAQRHTVDHLRKELWQARLFNRQPIDCWKKAGGPTMEDRVREEVRHIVDEPSARTAGRQDSRRTASVEKGRGEGDPGTDGKRLIRLGGRTRHIRHRLFNQIFRRLQLSDPTLCISIHLMIALTGT